MDKNVNFKRLNDPLFILIKSLTPSEKRYFKQYVSRNESGEQNNYILLFDCMESMKEYNENKILKRFSGKKFIKQLHVTKNYLYRMILQSMRRYNNSDINLTVAGLIQDVEFLYEKALYAQCEKVLDKTYRIAEQYDLYPQLLSISEWQLRLNNQKDSLEYIKQQQKQIVQLSREQVKKISNIYDYIELNESIFYIIKQKQFLRTEQENKKMRSLLSNPLIVDQNKALSFRAKEILLNTWSLYYRVIGDFINAYKYEKKFIELIESAPKQIELRPHIYLVALNNFIYVCLHLKRFDEYRYILNKFEQFKPRSLRLKVRAFEGFYNYKFSYYIICAEFEKGVLLIPEAEKGLKKYSDYMNKMGKIPFYFNFIYLYFSVGDYHKALYWLNCLLNDSETKLREDVHCWARMMNLIIHYELKNELVIPYILKSTYRFLYKRNALFKFETVFLDNIRDLLKANTLKEHKEVFKALHTQLIDLSKKPDGKGAFELFDFLTWLESKIENRSFAEIVLEKAKSH